MLINISDTCDNEGDVVIVVILESIAARKLNMWKAIITRSMFVHLAH